MLDWWARFAFAHPTISSTIRLAKQLLAVIARESGRSIIPEMVVLG